MRAGTVQIHFCHAVVLATLLIWHFPTHASGLNLSTHGGDDPILTSSPWFTTIINGADQTVTCPNDGSTLSKFFLCGTSDTRTLSLSVSGSSYEWQRLDPNTCAPTVVEDCPTINTSCNWNNVGNGSTYQLNAPGEYRVRVDGGTFYYFKASQNPLNPQIVFENISCGTPGSVEVVNVPQGYEYSLNSPSGPYQQDPYFTVTTGGTYRVYVRLQNVAASACIFPSNEVTVQELSLTASASYTDILCSGDQGSISVQVGGVPGFYTYRLVRNGVTVDTFGPNATDTYTFSNVGPGDYEVRISTNTCSLTLDRDSSGNPLQIGSGISPLEVSASTNESFGCGLSSVSVDVHATGGTPPYRYSLDGGSSFAGTFGGTTAFTVSGPGTYDVLVEDANGCRDNGSVEVLNIPPPVFSLNATDSDCGGANSGQISVQVPNSLGYNITYSIDGGSNYQSSPTFSNLFPGTYTVLLRYEQNGFSCVAPAQSITVNSPASINAQAVELGRPSCTLPTGGSIRIEWLSGGVPPFEYSIGAGFGSNPDFTNLSVGTYTPAIRDANGCVQLLPDVVFPALNYPDDIDFTVGNLDCATGTASVTLTGFGGTPGYNYEILAPAAYAVDNGNNPLFSGLPFGSYTFEITDAEGCTYQESYSLQQLETIRVQSQTLSPVSCQGDTNGSGRFLVDRFGSTYSYQINSGPITSGQTSSSIDISGLAVGSYTIAVTDETTLCTDTATLVIEEPAAPLSIDSLDVEAMNCQNGNSGSVTALTSGGWGSNSYRLIQPDMSIIGPRNTPLFTGLIQGGTYTLEVTDVNGCQVLDTFTLTPLPSPALSLDLAQSDFCYDAFNAAQLAVTASGGLGPYEYRINGGPWQASPIFPGLTPNSYTLEVNDANNCRTQITALINDPIRATASILQELTCSGPDARIEVSIQDGYPIGTSYDHYEVSINGGPYTSANYPIAGSSFQYTVPNDGSITSDTTYEFMVLDSQGCSAFSNQITISPRESIAGSVQITDTRCGVPGSGVVELIPDTNFGVPPYEYSNDNGTTFGPVSVFPGYSAGTHGGFVIRDSRGCESPTLTAVVGSSAPLDAVITPTPASCSAGVVEGSIAVNITNGTGPYDYELLDEFGVTVLSYPGIASNTGAFNAVSPGTYTVVTRDALGCEDRDVVTITESELDIVPVPILPPDCASDLSVSITIVGGVGPFLIRLISEPLPRYSPNGGPRDHTFSGLDLGTTYYVEVEDTGTGCIYVEEIPPYSGPSPLGVSVSTAASACGPTPTGSLSYTISGASGPDVDIILRNTEDGSEIIPLTNVSSSGPFTDLTGLAPGSYQVTVYDPYNGCEASALGRVEVNNPVITILDNLPGTCFRGALVTVRGNSGTPGYEFAVVPTGDPAPSAFGTDTTFELAAPGTYDFYLRDAAGCVVSTTASVTELPPMPAAAIDVVNQCTASSGFQIDVTAPLSTGSGLPGETFQYDIGGGFQDSPQFIVPNAGTYTITIRDGWGCTQTIMAEVFDFFSISAEASSVPTCNAGDGAITVTTTGGSGNFEYQLLDQATMLPVQPVQNTPVFNNIAPGNYEVVVTDLDSNTIPLCSDVAVVEVSVVINPVISAVQTTDISCSGSLDGSISVSLQTGTDVDIPLLYSLTDGMGTTLHGPQTSPLFSGLPPGTYTAEVVSQRGCRDTWPDITLVEPLPLQIQTAQTDFSCDSGSGQFSTADLEVFMDTNGDGTGTPTGTPPYMYSINDGTPTFDGTQFQSSNQFQIIDRGVDQNIEVIVRDRNGCEIRTITTFVTPADLTFSFDVVPATCDNSGAGVQSGSITVIVDQGPGNYEVELMPLGSGPAVSSGGTDRASIPIGVPGSYVFAVSDLDNGGCTYLTLLADMPEYNTISATLRENRPVSCFGDSDGEVALEILNYTGVYHYEVFSRTPSGDVSTGVTGTLDTNLSAGEEIIGGLPAGNLFVRVEAQDSPYCDTESNVTTVRSPDRPLDLDLNQTAVVTCASPGLGEITVSAEGGWGNYEYRLIDSSSGTVLIDYPNTERVFEGLDGGDYEVYVRDFRGCEQSRTISLAIPDPIQALVRIVQPLACPGDNNAIIESYDIIGGQGAGNYLYQLIRISDGTQSGLQNTPVFSNLNAGRYQIAVYDGWECTAFTPEIDVMNPERIQSDLVELQPPGCGDLGRMRLRITNPQPGMDYFYRRSGTSDPFQPFGTEVYQTDIAVDITMDPGPFMYDVQNSNGCPFERSNQISLDPAAPLVIDLDLTNATINCAGEATGIIRSEAFGGIGNYRYTLLNNPGTPLPGNTVRPEQDSGIFRNLDPGTYYVFARSGGCQAVSPPIEILPREPLVLEYFEVMDVSCAGDADGQIILEASGGTGRIRYSISDTLSEFFEGDDPVYPNRKTFDELPPRSYDIIIQDDLGCTITRTVVVGSPAPLIASVAEVTPEICLGDGDSMVRLAVAGGVPPYETSVDSANEEDFELNSTLEFRGLEGGRPHTIFIRDSRGCITNVSVEVPPGLTVEVNPVVTYGCTEIFAYNTVTIELANPSLSDEMLYAIDTYDINLATSDNQYGNLPPGEHFVYALHSSGCFDIVEFEIDDYEPLVLEVEKTGYNEFTATASGGFGGYEYSFQGESYGAENVFYLFRDTEFEVRVRDQAGCEAVYRATFDFNTMPRFPDYFTPNGDLMDDFFAAENGELFPSMTVKIYDRYGRVVARLQNVIKWDGNYFGKPVPTGDYWYVVTVDNGETPPMFGHFTLYR